MEEISTEVFKKLIEKAKSEGTYEHILARYMGVSPATLWKIREGNTKELKVSTVFKFKNYFGIPVSVLLGEKEEEVAAPRLNVDMIKFEKRVKWAKKIRKTWKHFDRVVDAFFAIYLSNDRGIVETMERTLMALEMSIPPDSLHDEHRVALKA